MAMQEAFTTTVDNLFAASQIMPVVADSMTVKTSQGVLKRGALLDKDGTLCKVDSGKTTISAVYAVLAEDVDTASGDKVAAVYLTGEFNDLLCQVPDAACCRNSWQGPVRPRRHHYAS